MKTSKAHLMITAIALGAAVVFLPAQGDAEHMSEELRGSVSKVVIFATDGSSSEDVTGSYNKQTPGLLGGMADGSGIGTIPIEVGGVPVGIPIPILREIGMIAGALGGSAKREIQEFRDRLTDDLKKSVDQPLTNDSLANDVFWGIRNVSTVQPKILAPTMPVPEDTDAVLYVALTSVSINVQEDEAIITITATARLVRHSDNAMLYRTEASYEDRDTLKNWTKDDTILWREYRTFARHYIGRELAAELYERVALNQELVPGESDNIKPARKKDRLAEAKTLQPTLAWEFELLGGDDYGEWAQNIDAANVTWDVEVYDQQRPVYSAKQVPGMTHTLGARLEACKVYRWTVRPTYQVNGVRRIGEWMRLMPEGATDNGNVGRAISVAHAYIQDFASFKTNCRLK